MRPEHDDGGPGLGKAGEIEIGAAEMHRKLSRQRSNALSILGVARLDRADDMKLHVRAALRDVPQRFDHDLQPLARSDAAVHEESRRFRGSVR